MSFKKSIAIATFVLFGISNAYAWGTTDTSKTDSTSATSQHDTMTKDDATITDNVKSKISDEKSLSSSNIDVSTKKGVVTLSGTVDSRAQKKEVVKLVKSVEGVKKVKVKLKVEKKKASE